MVLKKNYNLNLLFLASTKKLLTVSREHFNEEYPNFFDLIYRLGGIVIMSAFDFFAVFMS